jgi:drug/metabolite transporter (DMT)-like permease
VNTIVTKFADIQCAIGTAGYYNTPTKPTACSKLTTKNHTNSPGFDEEYDESEGYTTIFGPGPKTNETNEEKCKAVTVGKIVNGTSTGTHSCAWLNASYFNASGKISSNATWGVCNDNDCGGDKPGSEGYHQFDHPFVQALTMFVGEFMCLIVFKCLFFYRKMTNQDQGDIGPQTFNPLWWAIPALCDSVGTTTMYLGLTLTYASSFQMLRGAVVIFTGLASKWFLGKKLVGYHWMGMFVVLLGLASVGGAAFIGGTSGGMPHQILGDLMIICAQVIVAIQMVVEEKLMGMCKTPALQAVGWEGFFGCIYMAIFCVIFSHTNGPRGGHFEQPYDALAQIKNETGILLALIGTICSIATFNWAGLSVTKEMSATTRMVLDSLRTIIIWVFGLIAVDNHTYHGDTTAKTVHWETFVLPGGWLQLLGFALLLIGSALYNEREIAPNSGLKEPLIYPLFRKMGLKFAKLPDESRTALLANKTVQYE